MKVFGGVLPSRGGPHLHGLGLGRCWLSSVSTPSKIRTQRHERENHRTGNQDSLGVIKALKEDAHQMSSSRPLDLRESNSVQNKNDVKRRLKSPPLAATELPEDRGPRGPPKEPATVIDMHDQIAANQKSLLGDFYREQGLRFEKIAIAALSNYGFNVHQKHVYKTLADDGVDLVGTWSFLEGPQIAVQCKRMQAALPVKAVREFESSVRRLLHTLSSSSSTSSSQQAIGILATATNLSPPAKRWFLDSDVPLGLAVISEERPLCHFSLNPTFLAAFPHIRIVRQFNHSYASYVDIVVKGS